MERKVGVINLGTSKASFEKGDLGIYALLWDMDECSRRILFWGFVLGFEGCG